jgi:uncharacterized protein (DUF779 family)
MNSATRTGLSQRPLHQRVFATPAATAAIMRLRAAQGKVTLHHVDGASCEIEAHAVHRPLIAGRTTVCAGLVGGAAFCVDHEHDAALGFPDYEVDVIPAAAGEEPGRTHGARLVSRVVPGSGSPV